MDEKAYDVRLACDVEPSQAVEVSGQVQSDAPEPYPSVWQAIGLLALFLLFQLLGGIFLTPLAFVTDVATLVCLANVLATLAVLWLGFRRTHCSIEEVFPCTSFRPIVLLPLGLALIGLHILLSEADNLTRWWFPLPGFMERLFSDLAEGGLSSLIAVVIVAPLTEEPLCRGLIMGGFLRRYTAATAVLVSALLFAALHLNPYQFLTAFSLGGLLGWVFLKTGSLLPCILGHALFNGGGFLAGDVLRLEIPGYTTGLDGPVAFQPPWFDGLGLVLLVVGLLLLAVVFGRDNGTGTETGGV
jgi:hypothetical protein